MGSNADSENVHVEATDAPDSSGCPHVLLVDDEAVILRLVRLVLETEHFRVSTARRGEEALRLVAECPPDLIVLDLMMPEMDGFQVLERLRAKSATREIPVILMTGMGQNVDVMSKYESGALACMTKPANYEELLNTIRFIIGARATQAENKAM